MVATQYSVYARFQIIEGIHTSHSCKQTTQIIFHESKQLLHPANDPLRTTARSEKAVASRYLIVLSFTCYLAIYLVYLLN